LKTLVREAFGVHFWQAIAIDSRGLWMARRFASHVKAKVENRVWISVQYETQELLQRRFPRRTTEEILIIWN
jgi:hypothetical protein